ncbi:MAG: hypothetical protein IT371_11200 [Deltaproteobacteria bacterium]|nr:hypothetical protein [Deltaproteobacteria bacterium]
MHSHMPPLLAALAALVFAGCLPAFDNPYDPKRCAEGCPTGQTCFEGQCRPASEKCRRNEDCDDKLPCTADVCLASGCSHLLNESFCLIDKQCVAVDSPNPANPCQKCSPTASAEAWSHDDGKRCDDGQACTHTDTCKAGGCGGTAYTCDDKLACTADQCDGQGGCKQPVNAKECLIEQACYAEGAKAPGTACRICDPARSATHWSVAATPGCTGTLAGDGTQGDTNGPADKARFNLPYGVAAAGGKVYVADTNNHRIRLIENGQVSSLAGTGEPGYADGPAATAQFNSPRGVAVDAAGKVYVAEHLGQRIRVIDRGQVSTLAGDGREGWKDGPAASAQFMYPTGLAVRGDGTVIVADTYGNRIRAVQGGQVSTLAGDGTIGWLDGSAATAKFYAPLGVAVDGTKVLVADTGTHRIRVIENGAVTTLAGTAPSDGKGGYEGDFQDGVASVARFKLPSSVAVGPGGAVYVGDVENHRVRMIKAGQVTTLAGNGNAAFVEAQGTQASFSSPRAVALDPKTGFLVLSDQGNSRIRVVFPVAP